MFLRYSFANELHYRTHTVKLTRKHRQRNDKNENRLKQTGKVDDINYIFRLVMKNKSINTSVTRCLVFLLFSSS